MKNWGRLLLVLCLLPAAVPGILFGQAVNGSMVGTITDSTGALIPAAKVTITDVKTGVRRTGQTDGAGYYSFSDVTPSTYQVAVEKQGFAKVIRRGVDVPVNSTVRVDLAMQPGQVTQEVIVTAAEPLLQTDSSDTGARIETQQVEQLPLGTNRNFQNLLVLTPGAVGHDYNHSNFFNPQNSLTTEVNGTSSLTNNFQIEGVNDNERTGLLQVYIPAAEAIQEVNVTTSNYDAEQGTALGAVTNVVIKSGSNQFHGSLYEIYKGNALDARSFFQRGKDDSPFQFPHSVNNYFGGNIGGPIHKGKTFFFFDFLRDENHQSQFQTFTVPTADVRAGNFSDPSFAPIYDPATGNPDGTGRQQFVASSNPQSSSYNPACTNPGGCLNMIPTARIDPIAAKIIALVPLPNNNLSAMGLARLQNNYLESTRFTQDGDDYDVKIDQYVGTTDHISGRLGYTSPVTYQAPAYGLAGGPASGGFQATGTDSTYSAGIDWDHIFSPTLLTEARIGLNRYRNTANQTDYGSDASTALGIPGVNVSAFTSGLVGIFMNSTTSDPLVGYSASLPWIRAETDFDFVDNWTKTHGNHTLKWGGNFIRIRDDLLQEQTFSPRGLFNFEPGQTSTPGASTNFANNFASFLLGIPDNTGRDLPVVFPAYRQSQLFLYFNDKWQVDPKLTLNLGMRWEYYAPATPQFPGGFSNYDPTNNTLVVAGVGGNPSNLGMSGRYHDFAPRLGAAYRLSNKDVLRAGFGVSYEPFEDNTYAYNFPVKQNNSFTDQGNSFGPAMLPDGTAATFEKGFPPPLIATIPTNGIIQANTPLLISQSYTVIPKNYLDPYVESWNFTYERALPQKLVLDIGYVGNHGVHIPVQYNLNAGFVTGAGKAGQPEYVAFGRTAATTLYFAQFPSSYNSLQVKLDRHFSGGFTLTTAYTWGKSMGYAVENGDNSSSLQYYVNPGRNWARTDFDRAQVFTQSYLWNLPFGEGRRWLQAGLGSRILGGWEFSGILIAETGTPLNFGCNCPFNTPGNHQSPNVTGPIKEPKGVDTQLWFDTSNFSQPDASTFGNVGPYDISGPNLFNLDAALFRRIQMTERFKLEFRTEWFSATNTPQFSNPGTTFGSSTFGKVTGTNGGSRVIDFGAKLIF